MYLWRLQTMYLQTTFAVLLLIWIATGFLQVRPEWLERRTGVLDAIAGNARDGTDI
jgi:hypothetical protein